MFQRSSAALAAFSLALNGVFAGRFSDLTHGHSQRGQSMVREAQNRKLNPRDTSSYRFYSNETAPYVVDSLPEVNFDIGEMYAGLMPIDLNNDSRALFLFMSPPLENPSTRSQSGSTVAQAPGTYAPVENPYSWVNLTNMLWVEQPVGTGYTTGTPTATSEEDIAVDFADFFKNFETTFGIKNFKIFMTGESYAGRYIPYISAEMLDRNDTEYFDLSGALMYDPCIGEFVGIQEEIPTVPTVLANNNLLNLNASFIADLVALDESCGYKAYREEYLVFPASGVQPPSYFNYTSDAACDLLDLVNQYAFDPNPCFNIYEINQMCPLLWDVLGFPTELVYTPDGADVYFNRSDVKAALHVPLDSDWAECKGPVFVGEGGPQDEGDLSADPIQFVLPQVIEATNRVLVANGDYDMVIITNGTLLAIQNMTWNGALGFQSAPSTPIDITLPDLQYHDLFTLNGAPEWDSEGQGIMGVQHYERGLMWAETYQCGHMQPQFQPRVTYRHIQWVLGRIDTL